MKRYRSLRAFLESEEREICFKYRIRHSEYLSILLRNKLYRHFSEAIVSKIQTVHDQIVSELMLRPLPGTEWKRMRRQTSRRVSKAGPDQEASVSVLFELTPGYDLSIVVNIVIK